MKLRLHVSMATMALFLLAAGIKPAHSDDPSGKALPTVAPTPRTVAERGLAFLEQDAAKWKKEKKCASCHQGTMTVWVLSEAKSQGYAVAPETFTEMTTWTKERLKDIDKPRDTRPGWNMVNTQALYLAVMALTIPKQDAVTDEELKRIAGHLVRHQETDGYWAWSLAPVQNRPPPFFESDEVATLMASMALKPYVPTDPTEKPDVHDSRDHAAAWLAKSKSGESTQVLALHLLREVQAGSPSKNRKAEIDHLLSRQNKDGGWSQDTGLPSDAYATGQALYFLNVAGVKNNRTEIRRGVAFLTASQKEDGSWPMTPRAHPGAKPMTNPVPIIYYGSAWATMGLMRSVPK